MCIRDSHKWIAVIAGITAAVISFAGCAAAGNMEGKDAAEGAGSTAGPVAYTHLEVYKRQVVDQFFYVEMSRKLK